MKHYTASTYIIKDQQPDVVTVSEQDREHLGKDFIRHVESMMLDVCDWYCRTTVYADIECDGRLVGHMIGVIWTDASERQRWSCELIRTDITLLHSMTSREVLA